MKRFYDRNKGSSRDYSEGDLVWVERTNIPSLRPSKKMDNKRIGPFPIVKKVGAGAYKIRLPDSFKRTSATFNEALLSPFRSDHHHLTQWMSVTTRNGRLKA